MKKAMQLAGSRPVYFGCLLMALLSASIFLLLNGKGESFLALNQYHPFWLNVFFINYTFMGDGIFAICLVSLFFYWKKKQEAWALLYAFLLSGLAVQLIKNLVSAPRPRLFFEPGRYAYFLDHISLANNSSFPSGHTATAFAIATSLLLTPNKKWQLPLLGGAILVGISRIYLAQHFIEDVLAGAIIGTTAGLAATALAKKRIRFSLKGEMPYPKKMKRPEMMALTN